MTQCDLDLVELKYEQSVNNALKCMSSVGIELLDCIDDSKSSIGEMKAASCPLRMWHLGDDTRLTFCETQFRMGSNRLDPHVGVSHVP